MSVFKEAEDQISNWIDFKVTNKDVTCLARNIYYEAGSEPEEGKVAVGIVTINRVKESGGSICQVVQQKTMFTKTREYVTTVMVKTGNWISHKEEPQQEVHTVVQHYTVCQFSWVCAGALQPKSDDKRWLQSQEVAAELLNNGYSEYRDKYFKAMYFHASSIRPGWSHQKHKIARVGNQVFYAEN
jgi:spore germination cell wall hydrolase CwlJ-like protein